MNEANIPRHIAIIMDGNGRWAKQRGFPRSAGHRAGIKKVREIVKSALELGIKILTLFAFSTENWQRPKNEVNMLMRTFSNFLSKEISELHKNNIRFRVIGREKPLSHEIIKKIRQAEKLTQNNTGLTVVLAINYGGRAEIVDAAKQFAQLVCSGKYKASDLDQNLFSNFLYEPGLPEPDLLIRTSGEKRLSNFLLWELAYTEFYFTKKYWPDFTKEDLIEAISEYQRRQRRFGRI